RSPAPARTASGGTPRRSAARTTMRAYEARTVTRCGIEDDGAILPILEAGPRSARRSVLVGGVQVAAGWKLAHPARAGELPAPRSWRTNGWQWRRGTLSRQVRSGSRCG